MLEVQFINSLKGKNIILQVLKKKKIQSEDNRRTSEMDRGDVLWFSGSWVMSYCNVPVPAVLPGLNVG